MSELEEKLGAILSNQDAMGQIMALAKSLGGGTTPSGGSAEAPPPAAPAGEPSGSAGPPPASPSTGGIDPRLLSMAAKLAGAYSEAGDDRRVALLNSLRPFVKEERHAKLDKAVQIARLTRVVRIALDSFRTKEEQIGRASCRERV